MHFKFELTDMLREKVVLCKVIQDAITNRKDRLNLANGKVFEQVFVDGKLVLDGMPHGQYSFLVDEAVDPDKVLWDPLNWRNYYTFA